MSENEPFSEWALPDPFQTYLDAQQRALRLKQLTEMPYEQYLASPEWQRLRLHMLAAANNRCQLCNATQHLRLHHRTYDRRGRETTADVIVLCETCHSKFHNRNTINTNALIKALINIAIAIDYARYAPDGNVTTAAAWLDKIGIQADLSTIMNTLYALFDNKAVTPALFEHATQLTGELRSNFAAITNKANDIAIRELMTNGTPYLPFSSNTATKFHATHASAEYTSPAICNFLPKNGWSPNLANAVTCEKCIAMLLLSRT